MLMPGTFQSADSAVSVLRKPVRGARFWRGVEADVPKVAVLHVSSQVADLPLPLAMILFIAGTCWGSFAATLSERWPQGRSIVSPRSKCDSCQRTLGASDLVPLVSFILFGGKCRSCGASIPRRYPIIELACGGVGAISALVLPGIDAIWAAVFGWQLFLLALLDAEHFWLPNPLVASLAVTGVAMAAISGPDVLLDHALGGLAGFLSLFSIAAFYRWLRGRDGLGGGDPKLLGAIGLWMGWQALPPVLLMAALMGLMFAIAAPKSDSSGEFLQRRLPFGLFLSASAWLIFLLGW